MKNLLDSTIEYYDNNAIPYFNKTVKADMDKLYKPFIQQLPRIHSLILDAGSGSGRDTLAFLNRGCRVVAMDASEQLLETAKAYIHAIELHHPAAKFSVKFKHQRFEDLTDVDTYDGIWACSSFLHVPFINLPHILNIFERALKSDGIFYVSFKYGNNETNVNGRHFTNLTLSRLQQLLNKTNLYLFDVFINNDVSTKTTWLNALLKKDAI